MRVRGGRGTAVPRRFMTGSLATMAALVAILPILVAVPAERAGADGNEAPGAPAAFRTVSLGAGHSCAVLSTGRVKCWGRNTFGQLGLGDLAPRGDAFGEMGDFLPVVDLGPGRTATALAAGNDHTCALLETGSVKCWGRGTFGQLGLGSITNRGDGPGEMGSSLPTVALGVDRYAVAITAGDQFTCALLDDGSVKCWGRNNMGQLGLGDTQSRGDASGEMGDALPTVALGIGRTATAISAGADHVCALLDDATVKCWGSNQNGWLGLGDQVNRGDSPGQMGDALPAVSLGTGRHAVAVVAASGHSCALLDDGSVKCWGYDQDGQLGLGDKQARGGGPGQMGDALPAVALPTGRTATALSSSGWSTCVLLDDGSVRCWGNNASGILGLGDTATRGDGPGEMGDALPAVSLGTGRHATAITTGTSHVCARLDDGTLRCWGSGTNGSLGSGATAARGDGPGEMGDAMPPVELGDPNGPPTGIGGRVLETNGTTPVAGAFVAALRTPDLQIAGGAVTAADGTFRVLLPTGAYFLYLLDPTGVHTSRMFGAPTSVTTTTTALALADATVARQRGRETGYIVQNTPIDPRNAPPIAGAWAFDLSPTGQPGRAATANSIGFFAFDDLAVGSHRTVFVDPTGAFGPQFWRLSGGLSGAMAVNVTGTATAQVQGWLDRATPVDGGALLTGTVSDAVSGQPLADVRVIALRAASYAFAKGATTDADGHYRLDLDPGSYRLEMVDATATHEMEWYDDLPFTGIADAVAVTAPGTADAALAPTRGSVSGSVTDATTGDPVVGAWVVAVGPSGVAGGAVAAADGSYSVTGLASGTYRITVVDPTGARPQEYWADSATYDNATPVAVTAGGTATADVALG